MTYQNITPHQIQRSVGHPDIEISPPEIRETCSFGRLVSLTCPIYVVVTRFSRELHSPEISSKELRTTARIPSPRLSHYRFLGHYKTYESCTGTWKNRIVTFEGKIRWIYQDPPDSLDPDFPTILLKCQFFQRFTDHFTYQLPGNLTFRL